jgi:hypothetical protein
MAFEKKDQGTQYDVRDMGRMGKAQKFKVRMGLERLAM